MHEQISEIRPSPEWPQSIQAVITEEDRQEAGEFRDNDKCLLATTFRRAGHTVKLVDPVSITFGDMMNGAIYLFKDQGGSATNLPMRRGHMFFGKPYYKRSVVGKTVTCLLRAVIRKGTRYYVATDRRPS